LIENDHACKRVTNAAAFRVLRKRIAGAVLMVLGVLALAAPMAAGRWSLAVLGIPLMVVSGVEAYATFASRRRTDASAYLPCLLALIAGNLLLLSSALVLSGLLILLVAILVIDGLGKILTVWRQPHSPRVPALVNGLVDLGCAAFLWQLSRIIGAERAIGIAVGVYIAAAGWRMLMAPADAEMPDAAAGTRSAHPDRELGLPPNETFARLRAEADAASQTVRAADLMWMLTLAAVFLAIHVGLDADIGHFARHQFSLRCDRRRCRDDLGPRDNGHPSRAPPMETTDEAGRAFGVVARTRRRGGHRTDESRGWLADRPLA
jgi:uncharacterized membrane protein HdeD (DUF308 family)